MKILLIDNSSIAHIDGNACVYKATGEFAAELRKHHDVKFYGQLMRTTNSVSKFSLVQNGFRYSGIWRKKSRLINYVLLYLRIIPEILKVDFVYIFYPSPLKYVALICWLISKPYGVYVRGEKGISNRTSGFVYKKAKAVFTVTEYFTQKINAATRNNNAYTVRPMIPFIEGDIVYRPKPIRSDRFNLLFLARMDKDKGIDELLHAIKILKNHRANILLTLVGDGSYLPSVRSLVEELEIGDSVSIKGMIHDADSIKKYYLEADLYILPTYHEGFPRTIYESMIFGTPIATTLVGGIPSLMSDRVNCLEIIPRSVQSIVEQVLFSIDNPDVLYGLAVNARNLVYKIVDSNRPTHAEHLHAIICQRDIS